jgi:GT2 family glycosyltransferase
MPEPFVSVLLPTHARFKNGLLQSSVESVLAQKYKNFELLVADDGSSDGTQNFLETIAKQDHRVVNIRFERNVGLLAYTLAQAFLRSKGEFIAFAFDDTEWQPDHLESLLDCFQKNPSAAMVYGAVSFEPPGGKPMLLGNKEFDLDSLTQVNYIAHSGVMLRRSTVDLVGWLDPHLLVKRSCDWDLWMRIGRKKLPVICCPSVVAKEKGVTQPDSLGMSVTWFDALTRKYQQTERDHLLAPHSIADGNASMFEGFPWMDSADIEQLRILKMEHFLRCGQIRQAIDLSYEWQNTVRAQDDPNGIEDAEALAAAFNQYLSMTRYACKNTCTSAFQLSALTHAHSTLQTESERLRFEYQEQKRYNQELVDHNRELEGRKQELKAHLRELENLHQDLYECNKDLRVRYEELRSGYESLERRNSEVQHSLENLEQIERAYHELDGRCQGILRSLSWRITRPLREFSRISGRSAPDQ